MRLKTLTSGAAGTFTYNYRGTTGMLSRLDLPNGAKTEQSYDSLHRLTQVQNIGAGNANLASYAYGYDDRDVRTGVTSQVGQDPLKQIGYAYDAVDQLTGESATGGAANSAYSNAFQYDAMGNRTRAENVAGGNTTLTRTTPNELNQLTASSYSLNGGEAQNSGFTYDASGNLTQVVGADGSKTLYSYDDADRLVRIENRDAAGTPTTRSEFTYDYASRKVVSQEFTYTLAAWVPQGEVRRVFDGLDVVQERNALNEVTAQYTRDGNIGGILARASASGKSYFHYDGGGNVTALSDENGALVGRYSYDAFGNTLEASGERAAENPYRFSTKEWHAASGMVDFGFRFYGPSSGRWINRDPIRENGGVNLYAMVGNSPTNEIDPYGLAPGDWYDPRSYASVPSEINPFNRNGSLRSSLDSIREGGAALLTGDTARGARAYNYGIFGQTQNSDGVTYYGTRGAVAVAGAATTAAVAVGFCQAAYLGNQSINVVRTGGEPVLRVGNRPPFMRFNPRGEPGNSNPLARRPHYHRRPINRPAGPGEGIGRHRPWEPPLPGQPWWTRF